MPHFLPLLAKILRGINLPCESWAVDANKQTNNQLIFVDVLGFDFWHLSNKLENQILFLITTAFLLLILHKLSSNVRRDI